MNKYPLVAILLTSLLTACTPLQQAPLVYSSGQTIGIKVGAAPTQPDALELVIGVKILDAAYVPVAVARPEVLDKELLDKLQSKSDLPPLFAIKEIYGIFGEDLTPETVKKLNEQEISELQTYLQMLAARQTAVVSQQNAIKALEEATKTEVEKAKKLAEEREKAEREKASQPVKDYIESNKEALLNVCPDVTVKEETWQKACKEPMSDKAAELKKLIKAVLDLPQQSTSTPPVVVPQKVLADKSTADKNLKDAAEKLDNARKKGLEALQKLANVRKKDALSVFGSFDSDAKGEKEKVGLKLGKLFSTGVAAQNLTEAAKISAQASALSQCVTAVTNSIEKITDDAKRRDLLEFSIRECGKAAGPTMAQTQSGTR